MQGAGSSTTEKLKNQQDVVKEGDPRERRRTSPTAASCGSTSRSRPCPEVGEQPRRLRQLQDLEGASLEDVREFPPRLLRAEQCGVVDGRRRHAGTGLRAGREVLRRDPDARDAGKPATFPSRSTPRRSASAERCAGPGAGDRRGLEDPDRGSKDQAPMAVLGDLLAGGDASRFYQGLVKGREIALNVDSLYGLTSPVGIRRSDPVHDLRAVQAQRQRRACSRRWTRRSPGSSTTASTTRP